MKILFSQIKQLVPGLKVSPKKVVQALTFIGFMNDEFRAVTYQGKKDWLIGLEIRQNRADCLSVIGIAREVAAYWGLTCKLPLAKVTPLQGRKVNHWNIQIKIPSKIKRVLAASIDGLKNGPSPQWLQDFLNFHAIRSINLLVDLSNYVLLFTGYPSHLLDKNKISGNLYWDLNNQFSSITTLDGTKVNLSRKEELLIHDDKNILALAGIVGGSEAKIKEETTSVIAEMAIYDRVVVQKNSRNLHITTEASTRLEKDLDPSGAEYALHLLISLIEKHGRGKTNMTIFDYYPKKSKTKKILFNPELPSLYSGIKIPLQEVFKIFKNLRFKIKKDEKTWEIIPPTDRMDLDIPEDLVEEAIRMYGFEKIPVTEIPPLEVVTKIAYPLNKLKEKVRDFLTNLGNDEILALPLVEEKANQKSNYSAWLPIRTQNSLNEEYPELRQSLIPGLIAQAKEYQKKNLEPINIFEIGKVFGEINHCFREHESLGILKLGKTKDLLSSVFLELSGLLGTIGLVDISPRKSLVAPQQANPLACYDILAKKKPLGIIYKLKPGQNQKGNICLSEIDLETVASILRGLNLKPVVELTKKLITLDANLVLDKKESVFNRLEYFKKKIPAKNIWSIYLADSFPQKERVKYTVRVTYQELSDQEAKQIHLRVFELKK